MFLLFRLAFLFTFLIRVVFVRRSFINEGLAALGKQKVGDGWKESTEPGADKSPPFSGLQMSHL